jgi:hypothetical protein
MQFDIIEDGVRRPATDVEQALAKPVIPYVQIAQERLAQDLKWGQQNHPDYVPGNPPLIAHVDRARRACDARHELAQGSWLDIVIEEVAEAAEEAKAGNVEALREELIQTAAVIVAWIEAIDRRQS